MNNKYMPLIMTLLASLVMVLAILLTYTKNISTKTTIAILTCAVFIFLIGKVLENKILKKENKTLKSEIEFLKREINALKK